MCREISQITIDYTSNGYYFVILGQDRVRNIFEINLEVLTSPPTLLLKKEMGGKLNISI
jgi:hypothetical protein